MWLTLQLHAGARHLSCCHRGDYLGCSHMLLTVGAGKTTLMDVLAGRKTAGTITGDVWVGGYPKNQHTFARVCGYVEQTDIHSPRTTVREALQYSAMLRLYATREKALIDSFVDDVMDLVELTPNRDALVGMPGEWGLSIEQRKRLTIGVELVANPSIVFMDEPTSGLDARAAAIVMRAVRNTVNTGRTVVCTIHQPSISIFDAFDELLLLKRGGRTIYHGALGPHSQQLIEYFTTVHGEDTVHGVLLYCRSLVAVCFIVPAQQSGWAADDKYHPMLSAVGMCWYTHHALLVACKALTSYHLTEHEPLIPEE
eukprot:GHUV01040973.1.p1 GENE.GHUV01040973.1~~GHUV01040973.1.p1  ORF type:complete len:312 (+),score=73.72 GHUV01040973.1:315-1250(+)